MVMMFSLLEISTFAVSRNKNTDYLIIGFYRVMDNKYTN